ncbi:MAG: transcriptional activator NhaR [Myxococcales bacterium]|nr:transcriptional activator NhaR [Myxococcales bacterium]
MDWLNYHHLYYFWVIAKEGSITRATRELRLTQPTLSAQLRSLENSIGESLFDRVGRQMVLTATGRVVLQYADEIFSLGRDLQQAIKRGDSGRLRLQVGIADVLPKLIAQQILLPVYRMSDPVRLVCREDRPERLLAELALHELDVVLTDAPLPPSVRVRAFNHLLGESPVAMFAAPALARQYRARFPRSLSDAPILLPTEQTMLRRGVDSWLSTHDLRPNVVGEFEDSALLKTIAQAGIGVFAAPTLMAEPIRAQYGCELIGHLDGVVERFYAISVERRIKHPAVAEICDAARQKLFAE